MALFDGSDEDDRDPDPDRGGLEQADGLSTITKAKKRVIDEEAGVVVYAVKSSDGYGLAAVPIEDTDLELDEK